MKRRGLGLFGWQKDSLDNAFTYTAGVIVGSVFVILGSAFIAYTLPKPSMPRDINWAAIAAGVTGVIIGITLSHAGVLFWWRRLTTKRRIKHQHK